MRFAVTSTDGVKINSHFEVSDTFFIYDMQEDKKIFIEKRVAEKYSVTVDNQRFKRNRFKNVYEAIKDCSAIVTPSVGTVIMHKLEECGITIKMSEGDISQIKI